jgi:glycosyltransferase involved in cell wall biosynthesis
MEHKNLLPLVTIAIPCYNEGDFIKRAVLSAINQTYSNIEVIISDAGSDDNTLEFLREFESNNNIRVLYHKKGISKYENWTAMTEACKGEFILILPARHFLYKKGITKLVKPFIKNHDKNLAYVRGCMVYELTDGSKSKSVPSEISSLIEGSDELQRLLLGNTCEVVTTLYHLDRLRQSLPFNTNFERTFVWLQNAKLASRWPVYFINADIGEYTNSETSEQITFKTNKAKAEIPTLFDNFATLCSSAGVEKNIESYRDNWISAANSIPESSTGSFIKMKLKNYLPRPILLLARYSVFYIKQLVFRFFM